MAISQFLAFFNVCNRINENTIIFVDINIILSIITCAFLQGINLAFSYLKGTSSYLYFYLST